MSSESGIARYGLLALLAAGVALTAGVAFAGECPADKVVEVGKGPTSGPSEPRGVTDTVLAENDLAGWIEGIGNRKLRVRKLVIQPGGIVPWHDHGDRPAIIRVTNGTVVEHRTTCSVPIVHHVGEVSIETKDVMHWWQNETDKVAVVISSDILHAEDAKPNIM